MMSLVSFPATTTRGDAVKHLIILRDFLPSFCCSSVLLPPLGAPGVPICPSLGGVLWMFPSVLRQTFGVLYVALAFCLPSLSLLYFFVLFLLVWKLPDVDGVVGVGGVVDCQIDSIVDWFDGSEVPLYCYCRSS